MAFQPTIAQLIKNIQSDIATKTAKGLDSGASIMPGFIQANFVSQGTRGKTGQNRWARVSRRALELRKSYPHGAGDAAQDQYVMNHEPLRDTDALFNSFRLVTSKDSPSRSLRGISSSLPYGEQHEKGTGMTPYGTPIWHRPHMYWVHPVDTSQVNGLFEGAWQ